MKLVQPEGSSTWHVEIDLGDGKTHTIDTKEHYLDKAEKLVAESGIRDLDAATKIRDLTGEAAQLFLAKKTVTIAEAIEEWRAWMEANGTPARTVNNNHQLATHWMNRVVGVSPGTLVSQVAEKDVAQWVDPDESDLKRGSRYCRLSSLRGLFKFCRAKNYAINDPTALVKINHSKLKHEQKETKHKKVFTEAEIARLIILAGSDAEPKSMTPGFIRMALIIGRDLGLRLSDVCRMEWASIDFVNSCVVVWMEKTRSRIRIPMPDGMAEAFLSWTGGDSSYLFPKEREIISDPKRRALLSVVFSKFFSSHGFSGYSFHSIRATHATTLANKGATMQEIAKALGHSGTEVTKAYVRKDGEAKVTT